MTIEEIRDKDEATSEEEVGLNDEIDSDGELTDMDEEDDDTEIIRCKWQGDGAKTLDELIEKLKGFIKNIRVLKEEGWELIQPMEDDYGLIRLTKN